jgi:hypothetical protein
VDIGSLFSNWRTNRDPTAPFLHCDSTDDDEQKQAIHVLVKLNGRWSRAGLVEFSLR